MYAGVIPLLHAAAGWGLEAWGLEPAILIPVILLGALYTLGVRHTRVRARDLALFSAGYATLVGALVSPLHGMSEQIFSAHMLQHELLMAVAAPLLVVARPGPVLMWAFPRGGRQQIASFLRARGVRSAWHVVTRPFDAWLIHGVAIWVWHIPLFFQATLHSDAIHALQHLCFFGSALLFWWSITHGTRRAARGMAIVYLFTTAVHTSVLGALMTFAHQPWYPEYAAGAAAWGLTPMSDQALGGLIMWVPASVPYLVAALAIMHGWLRDSEWTVAQAEA
jgi:putative membrane protein